MQWYLLAGAGSLILTGSLVDIRFHITFGSLHLHCEDVFYHLARGDPAWHSVSTTPRLQ